MSAARRGGRRPTPDGKRRRASAAQATGGAKQKASAREPPARRAAPAATGSRRAPPRGRRCWLVKTEPSVYSIDDLARDGTTMWDGVRNYQARNLMRDEMRVGDPVLVYHSNAEPMAIVGLAEVASDSYADPTAFDPNDAHYDPASDPEDPTWMLVDLRHVDTFAVPLDRPTLAAEPALSDMMLLRRGSRLSVQPVTPAEYRAVLALAKRAVRGH